MLHTHLYEPKPGKACVIWLHGLGADYSDMEGLVQYSVLASLPLRHVFVDAPIRPVTLYDGMLTRAWYDIIGLSLTDREDKEGISQTYHELINIIAAQQQAGFAPESIFLAGFSQGGAIALYTALSSSYKLAGVISLSSYLPLSASIRVALPKDTPLFFGYGHFDTLVLPEWTIACVDYVRNLGYQTIAIHNYEMEHAICPAEVQDIAYWLTHIVERKMV